MKEFKYKVKFIDNSLNLELKKLKEGTSKDKELYKLILDAIEKMRENPLNSIIIKKKQIPKIYALKYNIDNLRMIKLNQNWRLLFTIASNEVFIVSIILEWMNHKEYEKRFKYKIK